MPAMAGPARREPDPGGPGAPGLDVAPFRGLRFDPAGVADLAAVTSPPYDVIDADAAVHLEQLDPHNVVRLILPRDDGRPGEGRYAHAARRLARWREEGALRTDDEPALYVYEQRAGVDVQRGLLGSVALRDPDDGVILPHEDVMPGPVADRLELMRATEANLEPILLVYDGGGATAEVVDATAEGEPLLRTTTEDGVTHTVWALTDPAGLAAVVADLGPRQALIADGHHRYATYRRLQQEHHGAGDGPGPWDRGLAMLVDTTTSPLQVRAIHRMVSDLPTPVALGRAASVFRVSDLGEDRDAALVALDDARGRHPMLVTDGRRFHLLQDPDPEVVAAAMPPDRSAVWRDLDASVLHLVLMERLWEVDDADERTRYVHDTHGAIRAADRSGGTAVLLRPVDVADVQAVAALGERMPRKSTSFGPKPRTGLVLRLLADG
jgi:uncharacterized protein (DUF1015 family)